jgi:hypothetical protein
MFPIIALGAAALGIFAYEELKPDDGPKAPKSASQQQASVQPQSYIVTPIPQSSGGGRQVSPVEAVRNWTF